MKKFAFIPITNSTRLGIIHSMDLNLGDHQYNEPTDLRQEIMMMVRLWHITTLTLHVFQALITSGKP
jgi:hypothetical protein